MNTPASTNSGVDRLSIALRVYAEARPFKPRGSKTVPRPSEWTLILDTETTTDAGQALRFGTYQVRKDDKLKEKGVFYRPEVLTEGEVSTLTAYAARHSVKIITQVTFIDEVFFGIGYDLRATIIGFNLPFDISRLAIGFGSARGRMRGGFTFKLSNDKRRPHVQIKHLSRRASFIQFAGPFRQRTGRSDRKRGIKQVVRRGFFVDVNTLANALFSRSFSLASLASHLGTRCRKTETDGHGSELTEAYIDYARQDVQVTWECYAELLQQYDTLKLFTPSHRIYSEASLGKAYLDAMNVKPWREVQPDVPPDLLGTILSSYYGGRAEVRIRRERRPVVLCDFLSMYPTVCTLMGLWRFVIAQGMTWRDDTETVRTFLNHVTVNDLQQRETWPQMVALVQVEADDDIFPIRAAYDASHTTTIGLNYLTCDAPLWFSLPDCIASKLLTERAPRVVRAIVFEPGPPQAGLRTVDINGNSDCRVEPASGDFYKRLIELRQEVKGRRDAAASSAGTRDRLDAEQNALKIAANATSYGIFAEVNVEEAAEKRTVPVHTGTDGRFEARSTKIEQPGPFFHPLLATLITGAARLMLALAERRVLDSELEWSFCDTDSMAIARPDGLSEPEFRRRVDAIVSWFTSLNPYDFGGPILKVEDVNDSLDSQDRREPLFCYAVSAKRYVLFNLDAQGRPVLRKASAHGLGHLRAPYRKRSHAAKIPQPQVRLDKIGAELWQHDLWWKIANASAKGPVVQMPLDYHPALKAPAVSRYAATTPAIQRWFKHYNAGRAYDEQVRPFGFLTAFTVANGSVGQPVAPFDDDPVRAASRAFDRHTGKAMDTTDLKTYQNALASYHLSPESKFQNGRPLDSGTTTRRHVLVMAATHIGKEADRWEEQFFLGINPDASIDYGSPPGLTSFLDELRSATDTFGQRRLADELGISRQTLSRLRKAKTGRLSKRRIGSIQAALARLWDERKREEGEQARRLVWLRDEVGSNGLSATARRLMINPSNLARILAGKRHRHLPKH